MRLGSDYTAYSKHTWKQQQAISKPFFTVISFRHPDSNLRVGFVFFFFSETFGKHHHQTGISQVVPSDKEPTCQCRKHKKCREMQDLWSLGREDPLEDIMANPSRILAWRIPDRGAWWAWIYGVAKSQTRLKWLSTRLHTYTHHQTT